MENINRDNFKSMLTSVDDCSKLVKNLEDKIASLVADFNDRKSTISFEEVKAIDNEIAELTSFISAVYLYEYQMDKVIYYKIKLSSPFKIPGFEEKKTQVYDTKMTILELNKEEVPLYASYDNSGNLREIFTDTILLEEGSESSYAYIPYVSKYPVLNSEVEEFFNKITLEDRVYSYKRQLGKREIHPFRDVNPVRR